MKDRPNILLFLPDGIQGQVTRPDHVCRTPNFDRLAERGVRFNRAHTVLPVCSPARASLMTGLLPHNHGVLQVEHCVDDDQSVLRTEHPHWAQRLSDIGYRTGYFGKWHIERTNRLEDFGWQVNGCDSAAAFRALGEGVGDGEQLLKKGSLVRYWEGPEGYNPVLHYGVTDVPPERRRFGVTTRMAQEFVEDAVEMDGPWACCVSFAEPNTPTIAGREAFEQYDLDAMPLPDSLHGDFADGPALYRRQREIFRAVSEREWREARACYYALVTELDERFGMLLDGLEAAGEAKNTIVIVLGDHGRYMGAHGFDAHNFAAFEEAYHIPLIVSGPGIASGLETDALVSLADVCPTLLEIAGAPPIDVPDSRSFATLLSDPAGQAEGFDTGYAEYHGGRFVFTQRVLWQGPWKFVFNGFDFDELYNLDDDPHELTNLARDFARDPAHQERIRAMMTEMWRIMRDTGDRAVVETHYPPMRMAAVGPKVVRE